MLNSLRQISKIYNNNLARSFPAALLLAGFVAVGSAQTPTAGDERARVEAESAKAMETNAKLADIMKAGSTAYDAKNYDEAIKQFDIGLEVDPTQAVFYLYKAVVLRLRGADEFNAAARSQDPEAKKTGKNSAREDFKSSTETAEQAVKALHQSKSAKGAQPTADGAGANSEEVRYLFERAESYRIALQTSTPVDTNVAAAAIAEYINIEPDAVKKEKMQASLGGALFFAGRFDDAIAKYRELLAKNPNNLDALYGLGLALAAKIGDATKDGALIVEARDTLQNSSVKRPIRTRASRMWWLLLSISKSN